MTLIEFLRARLDEDWDAAVAEAGIDPASGYDPVKMAGAAIVPPTIELTRPLREVDAKERLIDVILGYEENIDGEWGCGHSAEQIAAGDCPRYDGLPIPGLWLLARPYLDHPDYPGRVPTR